MTPVAFATAAWLCFPNGFCVDMANIAVRDQIIITRGASAENYAWSPVKIDCATRLVTAYAANGDSSTSFVEDNSAGAFLCKVYVQTLLAP